MIQEQEIDDIYHLSKYRWGMSFHKLCIQEMEKLMKTHLN